MRRRFPLLFLKKRGRRRTGSPVWARVGEALYHAMFVAAGAIGLWWSLTDVLLPEWRLAAEAADFVESTCEVIDLRVSRRPGLAEPEYCAELQVAYTPSDTPQVTAWTRHGVGRDTPSREEAEAALARYEAGDRLPCWYDPADPQRVLLSVQRRWWPWLVLSIPISLSVLGAVGLIRTVVSSRSSAERRSAMASRGVDLSQFDATALRPTVATGLPPLDETDASPGTEWRHRLAPDGAPGWRVAGMVALCLVWNLLVALFAYQIGVGYLSPAVRVGVAALLAGPLGVIGWRMTLSTWRDARGSGAAGTTRLEVDRQPIRLGETARALLTCTGPIRLRSLVVSLVCEEIATFRQGTDTRTATAEASRKALLRERRIDLESDDSLRRELDIAFAIESPHSFVSPNNEVRWVIEVELTPVSREPITQRFPLCVYPSDTTQRHREVA